MCAQFALVYFGGLCPSCYQDYRVADGRKRFGMSVAEANAEPNTLETLREVARAVARRDGDVDADRIWRYCQVHGIEVERGNVWGSIFRGKEWIWTGRHRKSTVPQRHGNEIRVWALR